MHMFTDGVICHSTGTQGHLYMYAFACKTISAVSVGPAVRAPQPSAAGS